jgi:purine-nucleoside phosphorylase
VEEIKKSLVETVSFLRKEIESPEVGIIMGSGLGGLSDIIEKEREFPYWDIPNFPVPTVKGHAGKLIYGKISGKRILAMQGRFHYYEGYSMKEITFPIRVMKLLGAGVLIVSNAAGGVNPNFKPGDIMIIVDHINLLPENPLRGPNDETLGPRFPSMHNAYNKELIELAEEVALEEKIKVVKGIYVALQGPNLETPSEYRMVRILGGDAVGMSTVPEVIVANHMGMKVIGFSVITNVADPYDPKPTSHEEVVTVANRAGEKLKKLVRGIIEKL